MMNMMNNMMNNTMNKLMFKFKSADTEAEYIKDRDSLPRSLLKYVILIIFAFFLYSAIHAIVAHTAFDYKFVPAMFFVSILLWIFQKRPRIKKVLETATVLVCLVIYGGGLNAIKIFFKFGSPQLLFYVGYSFSLFQRLIETRVVKGYNVVILYIGCLVIRFIVIPTDFVLAIVIQVALELLLSVSFLIRERQIQRMFQGFYDFKQDLLKFKNLITDYFPENIAILTKDLEEVILVNNAFYNTFGSLSCENLEDVKKVVQMLIIDKDTLQEHGALPQVLELKTSAEPISLDKIIPIFAEHWPQNNNNIFSMNARITLREGTEDRNVVFQLKLIKLLWDNKETIVLMLNDLTQQETLISLRLADANKDKVIATVSHELRTPLNAILGFINIMEKMTDDRRIRFNLAACRYSANLLLSLVNSILDLSQIRANIIKIKKEMFDLYEVLEEINKLFSFQCLQRNLKLVLEIAQDVPQMIYSDKNRLTQILINLLGNALKFTYEGTITLKVRNNPDDEECLLFSVIDSGIGINPQDKDKLFKMYGRLEQSDRSVNTQGVGLGLTIANELVKLLNVKKDNVDIICESEPSIGTTFSFSIAKTLDIMQPTEFMTQSIEDIGIPEERRLQLRPSSLNYKLESFWESKRSMIIGQLKNETSLSAKDSNINLLENKNMNPLFMSSKIGSFKSPVLVKNEESPLLVLNKELSKQKNDWCLLVDDNLFNLMVAKHILSELGYQVKTALNGQEAIKAVVEQYENGANFKFILMDCQMPVMDGFEASQKLTEMMVSQVVPVIPIIALSANNSEQDLELAKNCGMRGYLVKPLEEKQLVQMLNSEVQDSAE